MRYIFLICFFYLCVSARAQLVSKQEVLYENLVTGEDVNGVVYQFEERIDKFKLDTIKNTVVMELRGLTKRKKKPLHHGTLLYFDLKKDSILWDREILYDKEEIQFFSDVIIKQKKYQGGTYLLDPTSGRATKELGYNIFLHLRII